MKCVEPCLITHTHAFCPFPPEQVGKLLRQVWAFRLCGPFRLFSKTGGTLVPPDGVGVGSGGYTVGAFNLPDPWSGVGPELWQIFLPCGCCSNSPGFQSEGHGMIVNMLHEKLVSIRKRTVSRLPRRGQVLLNSKDRVKKN